jgi:NAD(P)H-quinone oxidoreductase subunit I
MAKIGAMLSEVLPALFKKPATEKYPFEKQEAPAQVRGLLKWDPEKCTGCQLCVKDCPADALHMDIIDRKAKRFVMHYHADRCIYCGQCVVNCRFDCLELSSHNWELAALAVEPFKFTYGYEDDIKELLASKSQAETE